MTNNGYDVVVDVDDDGDLGHTDLTDLEFHQSSASQSSLYTACPANSSTSRLHG